MYKMLINNSNDLWKELAKNIDRNFKKERYVNTIWRRNENEENMKMR